MHLGNGQAHGGVGHGTWDMDKGPGQGSYVEYVPGHRSTVIIERSVGSLFSGSISCGYKAQQSPYIRAILDAYRYVPV